MLQRGTLVAFLIAARGDDGGEAAQCEVDATGDLAGRDSTCNDVLVSIDD